MLVKSTKFNSYFGRKIDITNVPLEKQTSKSGHKCDKHTVHRLYMSVLSIDLVQKFGKIKSQVINPADQINLG